MIPTSAAAAGRPRLVGSMPCGTDRSETVRVKKLESTYRETITLRHVGIGNINTLTLVTAVTLCYIMIQTFKVVEDDLLAN